MPRGVSSDRFDTPHCRDVCLMWGPIVYNPTLPMFCFGVTSKRTESNCAVSDLRKQSVTRNLKFPARINGADRPASFCTFIFSHHNCFDPALLSSNPLTPLTHKAIPSRPQCLPSRFSRTRCLPPPPLLLLLLNLCSSRNPQPKLRLNQSCR